MDIEGANEAEDPIKRLLYDDDLLSRRVEASPFKRPNNVIANNSPNKKVDVNTKRRRGRPAKDDAVTSNEARKTDEADSAPLFDEPRPPLSERSF
jgi:hypothetical protein